MHYYCTAFVILGYKEDSVMLFYIVSIHQGVLGLKKVEDPWFS